MLTPRVMDIAFAATNYEEEEQEGNDDRALIRFEFFEILIRMVQTKYVETKKISSLSEGLRKMINDHIIPMQDVYCEWKTFRKEKLYDYYVNLLFERNMSILESFYDSLRKSCPVFRTSTGVKSSSTKFLSLHILTENLQ